MQLSTQSGAPLTRSACKATIDRFPRTAVEAGRSDPSPGEELALRGSLLEIQKSK
jgi:hypothetical protein